MVSYFKIDFTKTSTEFEEVKKHAASLFNK